jgi:hypothetical protein
MWRFALFCMAAPLLAQQQNVDLVLVLDATAGIQPSLSAAVFRPEPADRVAVLAFRSKSRLVQSFTNDPQKLKARIDAVGRQSRVPVGFFAMPTNEPKVRLFAALLDAAKLLRPLPIVPGRQRVIVAFFGTEDDSTAPAPDEVKLALSAARISVFAIAIPRHEYHSLDRRIETPPTLPGVIRSGSDTLAPLPEATMKRLAILTTVIGGEASSGDGAIVNVLKQARSEHAHSPE